MRDYQSEYEKIMIVVVNTPLTYEDAYSTLKYILRNTSEDDYSRFKAVEITEEPEVD